MRRVVGSFLRRLSFAAQKVNLLGQLAPVRPVILLQSDDWGRVGAPSVAVIDDLRSRHPRIGKSAWDFYGLETEEDLQKLGDTLAALRDADGRSACMTANFIMANADLGRMRSDGYKQLHLIDIADGFPPPWTENLLSAYRLAIKRGVFYPGLHGLTHFNIDALLDALTDTSSRGNLARDLTDRDVPYLASLTPEYNFALARRVPDERFMNEDEQARWIEAGVRSFVQAFGFAPRTACAPGYRANSTTYRLWAKFGVETAQITGVGALLQLEGVDLIQRNVFFEPVLKEGNAVSAALEMARTAVARGYPIVICSHSINYISRFVGRADEARAGLRTLCENLLQLYPDARFCSEPEMMAAYKARDRQWFRAPTMAEKVRRLRHAPSDS